MIWMWYFVPRLQKIKEKWCSWSTLSLPYFMFRTITIPVQPQPKILHSKSSRTKTHHVLAHLTTLIRLEHKSSWVAQPPRVPSAPVRTQDLCREAPAPTWASCGSRNGNVRAGQKSFCEALIPQRYQPPSEPANKLVSGQTNYFCLLHRHPLPNNSENRSTVLVKVTSVCVLCSH